MNENFRPNPERWQGTEFWTNRIKAAGVADKLAFFNDVVTEKTAPALDAGYHIVLHDIILDGKKCDVYHTDQDAEGNTIKGHTYHRVFIHTKN